MIIFAQAQCTTHLIIRSIFYCVVENSARRTLQGPAGEAGAAGEAVQSTAEGEEWPQQPTQPSPGAGRQRDRCTCWGRATGGVSRWGGGGGGGRWWWWWWWWGRGGGRRLASGWQPEDGEHPPSIQTIWRGPYTGCYWQTHHCYDDNQPACRNTTHTAGLNEPTWPVCGDEKAVIGGLHTPMPCSITSQKNVFDGDKFLFLYSRLSSLGVYTESEPISFLCDSLKRFKLLFQ